jgi:hypothetical protein
VNDLNAQVLKKRIYPLVGSKTTYLKQLSDAGKRLFGMKYKGTFPADKIPPLSAMTPYAIINLDTSYQSGSHWISLALLAGGKIVGYDSFGRDVNELLKLSNQSSRITNSDRDPEQKVLETDCGARCLAFLVILDEQGWEVAKML